MGFFDNLKNFISDVVDQPEEQTHNEKKEVIETLKENARISSNKAIMAILNNNDSFERIFFGKDNLAKNVLDEFSISSNEVIFACIKGKLKNFGSPVESIIITDSALYIRPELRLQSGLINRPSDQQHNRIPLNEFGKYIIYMTGATLHFEGIAGDIKLSQKPGITSFLSNNTAETSFFDLLKVLQSNILEQNKETVSDRDELFAWLSEKAEKEVLGSGLAKHTLELITILEKETAYTLSCNLLRLNLALRIYDNDKIITIVQNITTNINDENKQTVLDEIKKMSYSILEEIQDLNIIYSQKYLETVKVKDFLCLSVSQNITSGVAECDEDILRIIEGVLSDIGLYLYIRRYPEEDINRIKEFLKKKNYDQCKIDKIVKQKYAIQNRRMLNVYNSIKSNSDLSKESMLWKDEFGMTALHYSLILHNDDAASKIIQYMASRGEIEHSDNADLALTERLDYGVLCFLIDRREFLDSVMCFSEELKPVLASKKKLELILKLKKKYYDMCSSQYSRMENAYRRAKCSNEYSDFQLDESRDKLDEKKEELRNYKEEIRDLEDDIREINETIETLKTYMTKQYQEVSEQITSYQSIGDQLFFKLFTSEENLYKALSAEPDDCSIFLIFNTFFSIHRDILDEKEDYNYFDKNTFGKEQGEEGNGPSNKQFEKAHGDKWFSEEAYNDINVLRKEYHKLAHMYHPDNNPEGAEIFLDIENERSQILDRFK